MVFEILDWKSKERLLPKKELSPEEALREDLFLASKAIRKGLSSDYAHSEAFRVVLKAEEYAKKSGKKTGEVLGRPRRLLPRDGEDTTILHIAAAFGHCKAMRLLLHSGEMDINARNAAGRTVLEETLYAPYGKDLPQMEAKGESLGDLDRKNIEQIVSVLVESGAEVRPEMLESGLAVQCPAVRIALKMGLEGVFTKKDDKDDGMRQENDCPVTDGCI